MISSRSLMVNGQDKLVQGGEGEKGGGRDEVFENVWEVASPPHPSPELVSSILRTIFFFLLLLPLLLFCFNLFIITFLFFS